MGENIHIFSRGTSWPDVVSWSMLSVTAELVLVLVQPRLTVLGKNMLNGPFA